MTIRDIPFWVLAPNIIILLCCLFALLCLARYQHQYKRARKPLEQSATAPKSGVHIGALVFGPYWALANGLGWIAILYIPLMLVKLGLLLNVILFFAGDKLSWRDGKRWLNDKTSFEEERYLFNFAGICAFLAFCIVSTIQ